MKIDKEYSFIYICPVTEEQLTPKQINNSVGVCPYCGDYVAGFTVTHYKKIIGRRSRPSILEKLLGKKPYLIKKLN